MTIEREEPLPAPIPEPPIIHGVELAISYTLRTGLLLSVILVILGSILTFAHHPEHVSTTYPVSKIPDLDTGFPTSLSQTWNSVTELRGQGLVLLGILVLLATPIIRVAICIVAFALQKKWLFVALATFVLSILILSYLLGKAEGP